MQNLKVEDTYFGANHTLRVKDKLMDLSTPKVMAILNVTPDSFYSGSRVDSEELIIERVKDLLSAGADIIDVGGYSSRPGADDISEQEEVDRITPAIEQILARFPDTIISIDTFRSRVAEEALNKGAAIINDISGFEVDPEIIHVASKYNAPYILMHMRGTPKTMQSLTDYSNLFKNIASYFSDKIAQLKSAGVCDIILDPGFGFSKTIDQNYELLHNIDTFQLLGHPILAGLSRKSMIYKKLGITPEESLAGTIALNAIALEKGASILRVHDVQEAKDLINLLR
ncbi:MAG: dihydropteroate synthase [Crocinitomicaceae bacterium]|nr:dihydropteroate synthase [Crocinitomicaceae bacterium]